VLTEAPPREVIQELFASELVAREVPVEEITTLLEYSVPHPDDVDGNEFVFEECYQFDDCGIPLSTSV
jgi:hypothetical protein